MQEPQSATTVSGWVSWIVAGLLTTGIGLWLVDRYREWRQTRRRRNALRLVFNAGAQPYYMEQSLWGDAGHVTRHLFCVGVANSFDEPLTTRVVVEEVGYQTPPLRPERPLQVFAAPRGQSETTVQPGKNHALFEFAELLGEGDMAFLCYAESVNEAYVGRDTTVMLRAEGGSAVHRRAFRVQTHGRAGVRVPFTVELNEDLGD